MNYAQADLQLTGRNYLSRKLANNTYLQRRGDDIAVKLHNTDIVTYKPNGDTVLDSGGWHTSTTKARINAYAPAYIQQKQGRWFMDGGNTIYADGMTIKADGSLIDAGTFSASDDKAAKKRIKAYANLCAADLPLELPSGADCWYCYMGIPDLEHFTAHMEESYVVPSLVFKAMQSCGMDPNRNVQFSMVFNDPMYGGDTKFAEDTVKLSVYRYMSKQLGFAV